MTSYLLVQVFFLPKYNPNAFSLENLPQQAQSTAPLGIPELNCAMSP